MTTYFENLSFTADLVWVLAIWQKKTRINFCPAGPRLFKGDQASDELLSDASIPQGRSVYILGHGAAGPRDHVQQCHGVQRANHTLPSEGELGRHHDFWQKYSRKRSCHDQAHTAEILPAHVIPGMQDVMQFIGALICAPVCLPAQSLSDCYRPNFRVCFNDSKLHTKWCSLLQAREMMGISRKMLQMARTTVGSAEGRGRGRPPAKLDNSQSNGLSLPPDKRPERRAAAAKPSEPKIKFPK